LPRQKLLKALFEVNSRFISPPAGDEGSLAGCGRLFEFNVNPVSPRASRLRASYFFRLQKK